MVVGVSIKIPLSLLTRGRAVALVTRATTEACGGGRLSGVDLTAAERLLAIPLRRVKSRLHGGFVHHWRCALVAAVDLGSCSDGVGEGKRGEDGEGTGRSRCSEATAEAVC